MRLSDLLATLPPGIGPARVGGGNPVVRGIGYDSRRVTPGDLFVALRGESHDGHAFLDEALRLGAAALAVETLPAGVTPGEIIGLFARNSPQWIVACLGIAGAGAVVAPIDHLLDGDDLAAVLADAGCRRVFTTGDRAAPCEKRGGPYRRSFPGYKWRRDHRF